MHKTDQFSLDFQYFSIDIFSLDVRLWDHKCVAKSQDIHDQNEFDCIA